MATASRATSRLRFASSLAAGVHAVLALACYALHARAFLGEGLEKWVILLGFASVAPGMIPACILLDRTGINTRNYPTAAERRVARARLYEFTGGSSWPWVIRVAFAYAVLALLLPLIVPNARGQAPLLSGLALFHVIPAVVLFHAFRRLGKSPRPSDPIPSR